MNLLDGQASFWIQIFHPAALLIACVDVQPIFGTLFYLRTCLTSVPVLFSCFSMFFDIVLNVHIRISKPRRVENQKPVQTTEILYYMYGKLVLGIKTSRATMLWKGVYQNFLKADISVLKTRSSDFVQDSCPSARTHPATDSSTMYTQS